MVKEDDLKVERIKQQKRFKNLTPDIQKIWKSIAYNYELIEGAQLSNSFIILMALDKAEVSLITSSDISKIISFNSLGRIYKPASTLKDSLENRLKREGYVEGIVENKKTYYRITPKGKKLLKGWISFLSEYKNDYI
jgi:hypothetical protein